MTDMSNASYLILADRADDPGAMSAAICVLVARVEAAEEKYRKTRDWRGPDLTEDDANLAQRIVSLCYAVWSNNDDDENDSDGGLIQAVALELEPRRYQAQAAERALAESEAANAGLREALDQIIECESVRRQGGPAPEDLETLDQSLGDAVQLAADALTQPAPSRVADLAKAAREFVQHCNACGGEGFIYPGWPEEEYGQAPGSSKRPCPYCAPLKTALASFPEPEPEVKDE
jgi:hypothetical protein